MTVAYFDCFSGAGGDMIVGSLIDAGADVHALRESIERLHLSGYTLSVERVSKQGFAATRFDVHLDEGAPQPHRHLKDVAALIEAAELDATVKDRAVRVFTRLAEAEAAVHGTSVDRVHFHEVGAIDAIVDIVGAIVALDLLSVDRVVCSPVPVGSGTVVCEHGTMPVPAPATARLLRGVPIAPCDERGELITPTAAAILTTLATGFTTMPGMTIRSIGYGAGARDGVHRPNVLRVFIGETGEDASAETDEITILETNLDDVSPEIVSYCMDRLFDAGVRDAFTVPIHMKKGRPGVMLAVLCDTDRVADAERVIFAETGAFGIRRRTERRSKLRRRHETVATAFGPIRVKVGEHRDLTTVSPEFEDCRKAAVESGVAIKAVFEAARRAWDESRKPSAGS